MYWDNLTESDKKTWSNYMVHRFISMKAEWIEVVNEIQQYWELNLKMFISIILICYQKEEHFFVMLNQRRNQK